ncbi:MAG: twin-arginine translocase subunit TatC [Syntrophomonadaceae bacterium]
MSISNLSVEDKQTIIEHLEALRSSLIIAFIAILFAAIFCFYFSEQILTTVTLPLRLLNEDLIVTGVTEAFFVKLKISFYSGFVLAFPVVVWALWKFVKPALYPSERKYVYIFLPLAILLFAVGVIFAYFGILPLILNFFIFIAGENLETMFKVDQYVSFVLSFTIPFGLVFELPVVVFFLSKLGIIGYKSMARKRKYALLAIVVLAAALTPGPDPISQVLMAGPVYLLYEISIWIAKLAMPRDKRDLQ